MSGEWEYDPYEYAEELAAGQGLGPGDLADRQQTEEQRGGLSRRELLVRGGAAAAAVGGLGAFAGSAAAASGSSSEVDRNGKFTGTLRVLSLGVEFPIPDIAKQASKDLGFTVKPILASSEKQPQIAITSPDTFDVFGGYNYQSLLVWPSGSLQPVDTTKIPTWNSFYKLFSHGKLNPSSATCTFGAGNAPFRTTYVDPDGSTGLPPYSGGPGEQQADRALDRREREADRRQAAAPLHRRPGGPLQRRLDGLQRRRDQQGAEPGLLGRAAEQELEGTRVPPPRPGHHGPGRGVRRVGARADEVRGLRQPDEARDRPSVQDPDHVQEGRPVPCLLVGVHRLGELHGLEGGRDRVDVVARRGARQGRRASTSSTRRRPRASAAGAAPRASRRRSPTPPSCRPATTTSTGTTTGTWAPRSCARATTSPTVRSCSPGSSRQPGGKLVSPRPSTTTGGTASRPRETCPGSRARSVTSRRASAGKGDRSRRRICKYASWNSYGKNSVYLTKKVNDFLSA